MTANRKGWLDELWLCLDKKFAYERCKAGTGGLADNGAAQDLAREAIGGLLHQGALSPPQT